jgi:hypothetical protein
MAWWWWVLIWVFLVGVSAAIVTVIGLSLWRKAKILLSELSIATERLGTVSAQLQELAGRSEELAVFTDPAQLRQERYLARRGSRSGKSSSPSRRRADG